MLSRENLKRRIYDHKMS